MHQDPEHEDYDDDEYNYYPEYNEYGYPSTNSKKFNIDWAAWENWLSKTIKDIIEEDNNVWSFKVVPGLPSKNVNDWLPKSQLDDKYFMYLGSNHYDEAIWKAKYFINNKLNIMYKNHIAHYPGYFVRQPRYYRGMFENMN